MAQKAKRKLTVGLLFGGQSAEHAVSITTAQSILKAFDPKKYTVVPIGITKKGQWLSSPDGMARLLGQKLPQHREQALMPGYGGKSLIPLKQASRGQNLAPQRLDVIFPVLHGPLGEDGTVQGFLELANIPYVGSGVLGSALGLDKIAMKDVFRSWGLPIGPYAWLNQIEWKTSRRAVLNRISRDLGFPCFTKPANMGSSVGIQKCADRQELERGIALAFKYDRRVIVEAAIRNVREIECGVIGNDHPRASVVGEIRTTHAFYDYASKYQAGSSEVTIPAPLPAAVAKKIQAYAKQAFLALDCAGLARVDFFVTRQQRIYVNEVNTMPGPVMFQKLWTASGLPPTKLVDALVRNALERHKTKQAYRASEL